MDTSEAPRSALDSIETVAFKVGLKGYNVDEVDEFLERLSVEARQLKDQLAQQRQQLRQAAERINQLEAARSTTAAPAAPAAPPPAPRPAAVGAGTEQVTSMIAMAQSFIEHAQHEAEEKARELTTAAQERARSIVGEARSRAEDEVNRLNGIKQRLGEDVEKLARQLDAERGRLRSQLSELLRWIESSLLVGSEAATAAREPEPSPTPAPAPVPLPVEGTAGQESTAAGEPTAQQPALGRVLDFPMPGVDEGH